MSTGIGVGISSVFKSGVGISVKLEYATSDYCEGTGEFSPTVATPSGGVFTDNSLDPNVFQVNSTTGVFNLGLSDPGNYIVTYTVDGKSADFPINITALDDASFSYSSNVYTPTDADPTPTITGLTGGTFSGSAGLVINSTTGEIDLSASTEANHTITYTTSGVCPNSSTQTLTITVVVANNYSMSFDGIDDYIQSNSTFSALDGLQKMTLSVWVKPTSPNTNRHIISIPWDTGYPNRNVFRLTIRDDNGLWFTVETDSYRARETTQTLVFNQWNHIAVVVDSTQVQQVDRIKIYNNATFSKGSDNMNLNQTFKTSTGGIFIGENASNLSYLSNFKGEIDELAIWNTALTSEQVSDIYNSTFTNLTKDLTTVSGNNLVYWNRMGD